MSRGQVTLVLGGTRSGKSIIAEQLAARCGPAVTYVATAEARPDDADHQARIAGHRQRRPPGWTTVEHTGTEALPALLARLDGPVLVDSLGSWVAAQADLTVDGAGLVEALEARTAATIVVSEEVGWSVHQPTPVGRRFVDALGVLNQQVASVAGRVLLVVAGRAIELAPFDPEQAPC